MVIVWRRTVALFGVATSLAIAAPLVPAVAAPASVSLTGSVRTATGAVLVSARVAVENPATGAVVAATQTSSKGQFTLKVPPANVASGHRLRVTGPSGSRVAAGLRLAGRGDDRQDDVHPGALALGAVALGAGDRSGRRPPVRCRRDGAGSSRHPPCRPVARWPAHGRDPASVGEVERDGKLRASRPGGVPH